MKTRGGRIAYRGTWRGGGKWSGTRWSDSAGSGVVLEEHLRREELGGEAGFRIVRLAFTMIARRHQHPPAGAVCASEPTGNEEAGKRT